MSASLFTVQFHGMPAYIAKDDAERCCSALRKRWPEIDFKPFEVMGGFDVVTGADVTSPLFHVMKAFAEGFMASSDLWER